MINVWIIEDELAAYQLLKRSLDKVMPKCQVSRWLQSVESSIDALQRFDPPDLLLIDVQLSDGNSFEIFTQVKVSTPVIFTTAYDQYAIKAFELNSVDYLLKPLSLTSIQKALDKYQAFHRPAHLNQLAHDYQTQQSKAPKQRCFIGKRGNELVNLSSKHIAYFYSDDSSFCVTHDNKTYSIQGSLNDIESQTLSKDFIRLNRKVIAHRSAITSLKKTLGSKLRVSLTPACDFAVNVSRDKAKEVKAWYFDI
ncbi:LytR/AlgR family response regulator transcription factor [Thalassotalea ganghwensis]